MFEYLLVAALWGWCGMGIVRPHWKSIIQKMKAQDISAHKLQLKPHNSEVDYAIIRVVCILFVVVWPLFLFTFAFAVYRKYRERGS